MKRGTRTLKVATMVVVGGIAGLLIGFFAALQCLEDETEEERALREGDYPFSQ
jgi:hypothetical protein